VVNVMTMNDPVGNHQTSPPRFSLANIRREVLDLTGLLDGASTPDAIWSTVSQGTVHGLSVELDGQRAVVALDPHTFEITETASDAAPKSLRELARHTYVRYLQTCLSLGAFTFESIPTQGRDGAIRHDSLRLDAAALGAEWLRQLPTAAPAPRRRLPLLSELTVIDTPPPTVSGDSSGAPEQNGSDTF
jgi:hypothetical protein